MEQLERRNVNPDNLGKEPLSDITDNYFRAIIRAVLDKKMDLVRIQVDAGYSMSRKTLAELTKLSGLKKPTAEIKAAVALVMALEFGFASMKDYIKEVLKISEKDLPVFMNLFYEARELGLKKILKK